MAAAWSGVTVEICGYTFARCNNARQTGFERNFQVTSIRKISGMWDDCDYEMNEFRRVLVCEVSGVLYIHIFNTAKIRVETTQICRFEWKLIVLNTTWYL